MELNELFEKRRTIRGYQEGVRIERKAVEEILTAAQQAPSWKNSQTGRYYVVMNPEKTARVKASCLPERNANNCADAPVLIVTAFEKGVSGFGPEGPANELGDQWGAYDLGLQNAYLILKASELGYDTLIMGIRDGDALRKELNIPETQQVTAVIALGIRAAEPKKPKRKELEEIAQFL